MKREARLLLTKAKHSLILSVDHFNRVEDRGRHEAAVIFMDHAFEMLLKAAIIQKGGKIVDKGHSHAIGFDACLRRAVSDGKIQFLESVEASLLRVINDWRDAAYHHLVDIPEQLLYLKACAAVTVFCDICERVFGIDARSHLPERALPISTTPPVNIETIFEHETESIRQLLKPGSRKRSDAAARLRGLAIVDAAFAETDSDTSPRTIRRLTKDVAAGRTWDQLFKAIPTVGFSSAGHGRTFELRFTKKSGIPIHLVAADHPDAVIVGTKPRNDLDFYSLTPTKLAEKLGISINKMRGAMWHLGIEEDNECFKPIPHGKTKFKKYSPKALDRLKQFISAFGIDEIWTAHREGRRIEFDVEDQLTIEPEFVGQPNNGSETREITRKGQRLPS